MKKQKFIINQGTYPFDVGVFIGYSHDEVLKSIKSLGYKPDQEEIEALERNGIGRTTLLKGNQTIIQLSSKIDKHKFHSNLNHEIFHAVEFLMDRIGVKHNLKSSETWAYQIGYLTEKILEKIK